MDVEQARAKIPWSLEDGGDVRLDIYTTAIESYDFSDDEFAAVFRERCPLPEMRRIHLDGSPVGDLSIAAIAEAAANGWLPTLKELSFSFTYASNAGLVALAEAVKSGCLQGLESLAFGWTRSQINERYSIKEVAQIAPLRLGFPVLHWPAPMDEGLIALARASYQGGKSRLPNLIELGLESDFSDDCFAALHVALQRGGMPRLRSLRFRLDVVKVSSAGLAPLMKPIRRRGGKMIEGLDVDHAVFTDQALSRLADLAADGCPLNVSVLDCSELLGSPNCVERIAYAIKQGALPRLTVLELKNASLTDSKLALITERIAAGETPLLIGVALLNCAVSDKGVARLLDAVSKGGCSAFAALILNDTKITDASVKALVRRRRSGGLGDLIVLGLGGTAVTDDGAEEIAKAASQGWLEKLETLQLSNTPVGDDGLRAIAHAVGNGWLPSLTDFLLSRSAVTIVTDDNFWQEDAKVICELVNRMPIDRTRLSSRIDQEIEAWFAGIDVKKRLADLQLFWCIGRYEQRSLMEAGSALGFKKLEEVFTRLQIEKKMTEGSISENSLRFVVRDVSKLFKSTVFPPRAWEKDERKTEFRVDGPRGGKRDQRWTPRARKAWLYVDRYLTLKGWIPKLELDPESPPDGDRV